MPGLKQIPWEHLVFEIMLPANMPDSSKHPAPYLCAQHVGHVADALAEVTQGPCGLRHTHLCGHVS